MQKFTASVFFAIGSYLASAKQAISTMDRKTQINPEPKPREGGHGGLLITIQTHCKLIGLPVSVRCIESIFDSLISGTTVGDYSDYIGQLEKTISWEMQDRLFMYIPPDRANFYDKADLFGAEVTTKFPEVQFDIVEAGNSYAAGRATACVFHLMRVLEFGVRKFGTKLNVNIPDEKNWHNILEEIDKKLKTLKQKDPQTIELSEISASLYHVKVAWRNPTMHPKQSYTLEEAEGIMLATKTFAQQLANVV